MGKKLDKVEEGVKNRRWSLLQMRQDFRWTSVEYKEFTALIEELDLVLALIDNENNLN